MGKDGLIGGGLGEALWSFGGLWAVSGSPQAVWRGMGCCNKWRSGAADAWTVLAVHAHAHSARTAFWRCFCCVLDAATFIPPLSLQLLTAASFFDFFHHHVCPCVHQTPTPRDTTVLQSSPSALCTWTIMPHSLEYPVHSGDAWLVPPSGAPLADSRFAFCRFFFF